MDKWDTRMLCIAEEIASWSKDKDRKVSCVITTDDHHIVATGYNGYAAPLDDGKPEDKAAKSIHAEVNALLRLRPPYNQVKEYNAYVYGGHPCAQCASALIQAGCTRFVVPFPDLVSAWRTSMIVAQKLILEVPGVTYITYFM